MVVKSVTLLELKKQQWAKEKEELVKLNGYWRNQNAQIVFNDKKDHVVYPEIRSNDNDHIIGTNRDIHLKKNLSFPPISHDNQKQNTHSNVYISKMDKDLNIDNHNEMMDNFKPKSTHTILNRTYTISKENNSNRGSTSERQKWDKQYNGTNAGLNSNERKYLTNESSETPAWVEYSSEKASLSVNEIDKTQYEDNRKGPDFRGSCDTLCSLDSNNVNNRTYLLGQNIPLTTEELAARELKRQKAMELQEAIKQQLKERQLKKRDELEKKKQDELAEERRIQKQQEIEKKRLEDELKRQREKELVDERKAKAMQEVLENAQKQAKEDKSKHMQKKRQNQDKTKEPNTTSETVVVSNCEPKTCSEPKPQQNVEQESLVEVKENSKSSDVDVILQTLPSPLDHQKLLTPSKFRNQTSSIAIQTETLKKPKTAGNIYQKSIDLDKRPKWGVNRPEVQYIKQSAKDPNYQLKLRQKSSFNRRISNANSAKSQSDINGHTGYMLPVNYSKKMSDYGRPNFAEMKSGKCVQNKTSSSSSESISVSDVLFQLSSLRKVLETKRKHWKSVIADESPSSDSS